MIIKKRTHNDFTVNGSRLIRPVNGRTYCSCTALVTLVGQCSSPVENALVLKSWPSSRHSIFSSVRLICLYSLENAHKVADDNPNHLRSVRSVLADASMCFGCLMKWQGRYVRRRTMSRANQIYNTIYRLSIQYSLFSTPVYLRRSSSPTRWGSYGFERLRAMITYSLVWERTDI